MSKAKRIMRICRITSEFPPPGKGLAPNPYELSLAQAKQGHELFVLTRQRGSTVNFDRDLPFGIIRLQASRDIVFSFKAALLARRLHGKQPFDLIHAHGFSSVGAVILRRFKLLPIPVVAHVHIVRASQVRAGLSVRPLELWQERLYLTGADQLFAVSEALAKEVGFIAPHSRVINVGNGANVERFSPSSEQEASHELRLLFVGAVNGRKGEEDLLKACMNLEAVGLPWCLQVVGDGPCRKAFEVAVRDAGFSKKVIMQPYVDYLKMPSIYHWADVFVFPSRSEGMPKVVLEAMACGCPVILSDIPGCRELVDEGRNGYLVPPGRPDLLAEAVKQFAGQPELIRSMGQASRSIIEHRYTWDAVAERVDSCYRGL